MEEVSEPVSLASGQVVNSLCSCPAPSCSVRRNLVAISTRSFTNASLQHASYRDPSNLKSTCASHVVVLDICAAQVERLPGWRFILSPLVALPFEGSCSFVAESRLASSLVVVVDDTVHLVGWAPLPAGCDGAMANPPPCLEVIWRAQLTSSKVKGGGCVTALDLGWCPSDGSETLVAAELLGGLVAYRMNPLDPVGHSVDASAPLTRVARDYSLCAPTCTVLRALPDHSHLKQHALAAFDEASQTIFILSWTKDTMEADPCMDGHSVHAMELVYRWHINMNVCRLLPLEDEDELMVVGVGGSVKTLEIEGLR